MSAGSPKQQRIHPKVLRGGISVRQFAGEMYDWVPSNSAHSTGREYQVDIRHAPQEIAVANGLLHIIGEHGKDFPTEKYLSAGVSAIFMRKLPSADRDIPPTLLMLSKQPDHRTLVCMGRMLIEQEDKWVPGNYATRWSPYKRTHLEVAKQSLRLLINDIIPSQSLVADDRIAPLQQDKVEVQNFTGTSLSSKIVSWLRLPPAN